MSKKYFGTDGIRGRVGKSPITPDFMLRLGWAVGKLFAQESHTLIVIGKDTRLSGYMFESALESGLVAAGANVLLTGPMPTPAIAYLTRTLKAQAGIVISASHNPYYDNGIKFFCGQGKKLSDEVELQIEALLEEGIEVVDSARLGKVNRLDDAQGRYIEYCKSTLLPEFNLRNQTIVLDTAHGATYQLAPQILRELGAEVIVLGDSPDGLNINHQVGSTYPQSLQKTVLDNQADLGIAFDGDGDRVIMVDRNGNLVDGDLILYILAVHKHSTGDLKGGVVGTLMTNLGIEVALKEKGIPLLRTKVGDRYVSAVLQDKNWQLGGESSGHIICQQISTTGDGIISSLQVLNALNEMKMSLHQFVESVKIYPMHLINVRIEGSALDLLKSEKIQVAVRDIEQDLGQTGRVLLRSSGTEPLVRVMIEGQNEEQVIRLCERLASVVQAEVGE